MVLEKVQVLPPVIVLRKFSPPFSLKLYLDLTVSTGRAYLSVYLVQKGNDILNKSVHL